MGLARLLPVAALQRALTPWTLYVNRSLPLALHVPRAQAKP